MTERNWRSRLKNIPSVSLSALEKAAAFCQDSWHRSGLSDDWSGTHETLLKYWRVYGGSRALFRSPAFLLSVLLSTICYPLWWSANSSAPLVLSVVPNLLGFSIGAMAVVLAFPTTTVFEIITEGGR